MSEPRFFNPWEEIQQSQNRLPHGEQPGSTYFLTFSLADSVPKALRLRWKEERETWLRANPEPWDEATESKYHERFSGAAERWLDAGYGSCLLRQPEASKIVAEALEHFDRDRYWQYAWVVMPNHVHVVCTLAPGWELRRILHSWKSFSSHELVSQFVDAPKPFCQRDYFDRMVRDRGHFANCIRYIRRNPVKAKLGTQEFRHYECGTEGW